MLNYYDDRNKEEDSFLDEEIIMELDSYTGSQGSGSFNWKITRRRTKDYKYVGMDKATAKACAAAKRAQYLRTFFTWTFKNGLWVQNRTNASMYKQCVANVKPQRLTGNMWNVVIQVDETCVCYLHGGPNTPSMIDPNYTMDSYCGSASWSYDE